MRQSACRPGTAGRMINFVRGSIALMRFIDLLQRIIASLGLSPWWSRRPVAGLVAAVVVFDREDLSMALIAENDEEDIVDQLRNAVERDAAGKYDGADWSSSVIQWFFFAEDATLLETALLKALRAEPRCNGARLRVTRNGIAGPWRETRI